MSGIEDILNELGADDADQLFSDIPQRARTNMDLPLGMDEIDLLELFKGASSKNMPSVCTPSFLGGEFQGRHIPAAVQAITSRGELFTAYTSYQPEVSQGMLQALFEYQSMMAELTSMDVVNASLYDGSTGLGEALRLACRATRKKHFLIPSVLSSTKKKIARLYTTGLDASIEQYSYDLDGSSNDGRPTGRIEIEKLLSKITPDTAAVYVEMPNALGVLDESLLDLKEQMGKTLLIVGVDPVSLVSIKPPGDYGADIVIGEGQPMGLPLGFGGPTLGILGVTKKLVRKMPGRVVGLTKDSQGNRAFCITLQTREQHIRREKATSNICTNEALCAVTAASYMATMGRKGLARLANILVERSHKLAHEIQGIPGFEAPAFDSPFFNSFSMRCPAPYNKVHQQLLRKGIQGGQSLWPIVKGEDKLALFSVNETIPQEAYRRLVASLHEIKGWGGEQ